MMNKNFVYSRHEICKRTAIVSGQHKLLKALTKRKKVSTSEIRNILLNYLTRNRCCFIIVIFYDEKIQNSYS